MKKEVEAWNPPLSWIQERIEEAGNTIGSVHFNKRKDGSLRKMCYRLHVKAPSIAKSPISSVNKSVVVDFKCPTCGRMNCPNDPRGASKVTVITPKKPKISKKEVDKKNNQMTVLDANKVVRDSEGKVVGRGAWRTVPLEKVIRISNKGVVYNIHYTD